MFQHTHEICAKKVQNSKFAIFSFFFHETKNNQIALANAFITKTPQNYVRLLILNAKKML